MTFTLVSNGLPYYHITIECSAQSFWVVKIQVNYKQKYLLPSVRTSAGDKQ